MNFEREIIFTPAFDRRHENPSKNYGIHGVDMRWILKGEEGAVQFDVYTNWHLPHVVEEMDEKILNNRSLDRIDLKITYHPMPEYIGYHSPKPLYEGQEPMSQECEYVNGECYYGGSRLHAKKVFEIFVKEGGEAVWKYLEEYYQEIFKTEIGGE